MPRFDLAPIGNCAVASLIDRRGRHVWFCFPRLDGDPLFNALVNGTAPDGGFMDVVAEGERHFGQSYLRNTAILETNIRTANDEEFRIIDFAPRFRQLGRNFRPPMLVRRIEPVKGQPRLTLRIRPTFDYGAAKPEISIGSNHIRYVGADQVLRVTADVGPSYILDEAPFLLTRPINLFVGSDESVPEEPSGLAIHFLHETKSYWEDWTRKLAIPFEWQAAVLRAAITLKLCSYEETGAIVAALTTWIPESAHSGRNWDYRYCWLRDAFFVVRALNSISEVGTMEDYLRWLSNVVVEGGDGHIQPLYGIGLEKDLPESFVPQLAGYRGMGPVRVGNQAAEHFQHDVYGNIVLGAAQAFHDHRLLHRAGLAEFKRLEQVGDNAVRVYGQPDAGMWELRTRARVHTSSALMSWAACDRLAKIAATLQLADRASHWQQHADRMRAEILDKSWCEERQAFAESFGGHELDASVLLMAEVGLIDPKDPRFVSTVEAMEKSLCDGPYMRRYEAADDFGKPETAFNICTFWRIDALARIGRKAEARAIFETMLAARNPLGLLSEDTHPDTREMWGNFPQTYSMVGVINAAVRLSAPWDSVI